MHFKQSKNKTKSPSALGSTVSFQHLYLSFQRLESPYHIASFRRSYSSRNADADDATTLDILGPSTVPIPFHLLLSSVFAVNNSCDNRTISPLHFLSQCFSPFVPFLIFNIALYLYHLTPLIHLPYPLPIAHRSSLLPLPVASPSTNILSPPPVQKLMRFRAS